MGRYSPLSGHCNLSFLTDEVEDDLKVIVHILHCCSVCASPEHALNKSCCQSLFTLFLGDLDTWEPLISVKCS